MPGLTDGDGVLDPDGAMEYLGRWKADIERRAADTQAASDRLARLRVGGRDGNDLVEVTIDSTGVLVDLRFTTRIQRVEPDAVARAVLTAVGNARRQAAERSREIIVETMGPDSVAGQAIADRVERQLREPGPDDDAWRQGTHG
ncbi:YbaB/EbfC family nucleoid-associated protein [Actinoplanes sp. NPDC026623]|uniref:YbaB/EbfC family nucleoid-associated protein n=1 Tax=Actinoplanes sp. NPDC026623 TaxID=3155610 RepID=UPI0033FE2061